jgi:hypothetical protein
VLSDVPALVAALRAAVARVAALDPDSLSDGSLLVGLGELLAVETQLRAVQTRWLAAADAREVTVAIAGRATRSWLVEDCQLGGRDAATRMRLARSLGAFPALQAAFAAARVTAEQASAIMTGLLDVPADCRDEVETALVRRAGELTPFGLSREIDTLLAALQVESAAERAEAVRQRRLARRGVDLDPTLDGTGSLAGTLAPDVHDALSAALHTIDPAGSPEDERTPRQRRHDALGALARHYLDNAANAPTVNGERPRIVLTITAADPTGTARSGRFDFGRLDSGRLDSGLPVSPETAQRLACDATVLPVVLDNAGDVLRLGRTTRTWTTAQRRAAWTRDHGRCTYPRCRRPPADLHHIQWWTRGGRTDLDNAAWLCAFHHWLIHERHWTLRRDPDRGYVFTAPDGHTIHTHTPRQRAPA